MTCVVREDKRACPLDSFRRPSKQGVRRSLGWSDALRKGTSKDFFRALLRQAHQRLSEFCLGTIERSSSTSALCILMLANDAMCIIMHFDFLAKKNGGGVLRDDSRRDFISNRLICPAKRSAHFRKNRACRESVVARRLHQKTGGNR